MDPCFLTLDDKRTALAACLAFLWLNDHDLEADEDELTDLVIGVAAGSVSKAQVAVFLDERVARLEGTG